MRTFVIFALALLPLPASAQLPEGAVARCGSMAWRHPGGIESLTYAGGQLVGSGPGGVRVWDAEGNTRRLIRSGVSRATRLRSGASRVIASPDGKTVLATGARLRWIDVASGRVTRALPVKTEGYTSCAWSSDGRTVFAGTGRGALMAIGSGSAVRWETKAQGSSGPVTDLAVSPDGRTLAVCQAGVRIVALVVAADGTRLRTLHPGGNAISRVAWSADGTMLAGGGENASLTVWRADGTRLYQTPAARLIGEMTVVSVAFTRNAVVYGIGHAGRVRLLRIQRDGVASPTFRGVQTGLRGSILAVSSDGRTMAVAFRAVVARVDLVQRRPIGKDSEARQGTSCLAWSRDGKELLTGDYGRQVQSWTARGQRTDLLAVKGSLAKGLDISPDGTLVAVREEPPSQHLRAREIIRIWRRTDSTLVHELPTSSRFSRTRPRFSPDGRWLAYGGSGSALKIWNVKTGATHRTLVVGATGVDDYAWSADSRRILAACEGGRIEVWNVATGARISVKPAPTRNWTDSQEWRWTISEDWSVAALSLKSGEVVIRDVDSGKLRGRIPAAGRGYPRVACSLDGRWIAITGPGTSLRLVDAKTGALVRTVPAGGAVSLLTFSRTGLLATAMRGGTTLLWDVARLAGR